MHNVVCYLVNNQFYMLRIKLDTFACRLFCLQVSSIRNHDLFDYSSLDYDISILTLSSVITFSLFSPVCLPSLPSNSWYPDYAGQVATVTGWGNTASGGSPSNTLQEVNVTVISNQDCSEAYRNYQLKR